MRLAGSGADRSRRRRRLWTTGRLWITPLDQEAAAVAELEADDAEPDPDPDPDFDFDPDFDPDSVDPDFEDLASDVDLPLVSDSDFFSPPASDLPLAPLDSDLPFELDGPSCAALPARLSVR